MGLHHSVSLRVVLRYASKHSSKLTLLASYPQVKRSCLCWLVTAAAASACLAASAQDADQVHRSGCSQMVVMSATTQPGLPAIGADVTRLPCNTGHT